MINDYRLRLVIYSYCNYYRLRLVISVKNYFPEWRSMCERLATAEQSLTQRDEKATRLAARSARILTIVSQLVQSQWIILLLFSFINLIIRNT